MQALSDLAPSDHRSERLGPVQLADSETFASAAAAAASAVAAPRERCPTRLKPRVSEQFRAEPMD